MTATAVITIFIVYSEIFMIRYDKIRYKIKKYEKG